MGTLVLGSTEPQSHHPHHTTPASRQTNIKVILILFLSRVPAGRNRRRLKKKKGAEAFGLADS